VRQRWLGSTGRRVAEIAVEGEDVQLGDDSVTLEGTRYEVLVASGLPDDEALRTAHEQGKPVVVRALDAEGVKQALSRPEVSFVVVPPDQRELLELDLRRLTYGH
jgi:hypothetical protein